MSTTSATEPHETTEAHSELQAHDGRQAHGDRETYWRAGFVADGQQPIVVERHCRTVEAALRQAEDAAKAHHQALIDVGVFLKVRAFVQRWTTQRQGNVEHFAEAEYSTRIILDPPKNLRSTEAIQRARSRAAQAANPHRPEETP